MNMDKDRLLDLLVIGKGTTSSRRSNLIKITNLSADRISEQVTISYYLGFPAFFIMLCCLPLGMIWEKKKGLKNR